MILLRSLGWTGTFLDVWALCDLPSSAFDGTGPRRGCKENCAAIAPFSTTGGNGRFESVTGITYHVLQATETPFRVELFLLSEDAYDQERFARRRCIRTLERDVWMPTAEDVVITKLRWALLARRPKDREDARNVLAVQGERLDWDYIHRWCEQHGTRALLDEIRSSIPQV